jgi:hypothetical protein
MYKIENISAATVESYKNCFDINNSPKSILSIKWQFLENTINKQFVNIYIDQANNKVAAIYAIAPVEFKIQNNYLLASQSLDTITDVDYRGKGFFIKLATDLYEKAKDENIKLVYGFPNGNSIHGFSKKLSWKVLDPVPFLIKPIRASYFTKKIKILSWLPNFKLAFQNRISKNIFFIEKFEFPNEVNTIWKKFSNNIPVAVERNKAYLDWRYISKPNENYKILHGYTADNTYIGFIVYCVKKKHGGNIAYIMEYIYDPKYELEARYILKKAINNIIIEKADCILTWCFKHSPNFRNYKKNLFINIPEILKPIELHFGVRSFDESLNNDVYERTNWYLSYSDSDTV